MPSDYLIVHKSALPDVFEKVIETRRLIESGKINDVSQAVKITGLSRSTYYKYRDLVFEPSSVTDGKKAVFMAMLDHVPGTLSALLNCISSSGANVLTISQSIPVNGMASVTFSLDVGSIRITVEELIAAVSEIKGIQSIRLISIE